MFGRLVRQRIREFNWSYVFIELLIVTTGVLTALALDQWISSRKERAEEDLLLGAVRTELQAINTELDGELIYRAAVIKSLDEIYAMSAADAPPDPSAIDLVLGNMLWWSNADFPIGAVESILVSGKLRLVENEEIRFFLAGLPERLEIVKQVESQDYETLMNVVTPYLRTHSDMSQIGVAITMRPGSTDRSEPFISYRPREIRDHAPHLRDTEFLGIVTQVSASQSNVVDAYNALRPDLNKVIGLLDAELIE